MATNPKPLRTMEKRFFMNRVKQKNFKKSVGPTGYLFSRDHYILVKRQVVKVDFCVWAIWFEKNSRNRGRVIKSTQVAKDIRVSTVFLGVDARELFETMIFGGQHHQYQDRYTTYEDALAGHQRACELAFEVPQ